MVLIHIAKLARTQKLFFDKIDKTYDWVIIFLNKSGFDVNQVFFQSTFIQLLLFLEKISNLSCDNILLQN